MSFFLFAHGQVLREYDSSLLCYAIGCTEGINDKNKVIKRIAISFRNLNNTKAYTYNRVNPRYSASWISRVRYSIYNILQDATFS